MVKYALQRTALMLFTLFIITLMCFVLIRMLPLAPLPIGDPHTAVIEARREALGYNKPYLVQFGIFLRDVFTKWDWGICDSAKYYGKDVAQLFTSKLPASMIVNLYSIIFSIPIGIALG
ncbi:MAG: hypothetical protein IIX09_04920, partial [Clostridia bacterium]|nr:hypothetical protein [Clostridia bacterium]